MPAVPVVITAGTQIDEMIVFEKASTFISKNIEVNDIAEQNAEESIDWQAILNK